MKPSYEGLNEYGKALSDAYHSADNATSKAVLAGLFGAHTNSGGTPIEPPGKPSKN